MPVKSVILLDPEDIYGAKDPERMGDLYTRFEILCNSLMTQFLGSNITEELIQCIFEHIKMQVKNLRILESGFMLDQIMHFYFNFHNITLTERSTCIEL